MDGQLSGNGLRTCNREFHGLRDVDFIAAVDRRFARARTGGHVDFAGHGDLSRNPGLAGVEVHLVRVGKDLDGAVLV